jgi:hypothetical protein
MDLRRDPLVEFFGFPLVFNVLNPADPSGLLGNQISVILSGYSFAVKMQLNLEIEESQLFHF